MDIIATMPPKARGSVEGASTVTTGEVACGPGSADGSLELEVRDTTVKQIAPRPDWR